MNVLDLFSAAAGGWSLGMHRAGFRTMAACEYVAWRRALYQENNPGVLIYDDVRTLTADRILRDCGSLPDVVVGSPPCQDISSANTKGKGVEGERSGLYFEAVRIIGECRPRWFALENSANLRTRGADAVLAALETLGYACWAFVVGAGHVGANHERARSWLIGFDPDQVTDAGSWEQREQPGRGDGPNWSSPAFNGYNDPAEPCDAESDGWSEGRSRGCAVSASRVSVEACGDAANSGQERQEDGKVVGGLCSKTVSEAGCFDGWGGPAHENADTTGERQKGFSRDHERREGKIAKRPNVFEGCEVGKRESVGDDLAEPWADWNLGLAGHLRVDDGLSAWVAQSRVAVGGPKGTSAASLIVEAYGDAVVPQIPEAIGRAMIRTEAALRAVCGRAA